MTLDKAERILARARRSGGKDLSDLAIARKTDNSCRATSILLAMMTINMLRSAGDRGDWVYWLLVVVPAILAIYSLYQGHRYSKIRELFEEAGPQNLRDLRASSPAARRETWPQ